MREDGRLAVQVLYWFTPLSCIQSGSSKQAIEHSYKVSNPLQSEKTAIKR